MGLYMCFLVSFAAIVAMVGAQDDGTRHGHPRVSEGHGHGQAQPIGFRRIRIQRVRPGARVPSSSPESATSNRGAGSEDWGVRAITDDPYTFYHQDYNRREEMEGGAQSEELDETERERHEQLQKMRLLQLQRELMRPSSHLQQPGWPESIAHAPGVGGGGGQTSNNNDTRNNTSSPYGTSVFPRKRNCTTYNTTSGQVERCEDANTTEEEDEEGVSDRRHHNPQDWIVQERTKQARLFMIQASILHKLGMQRQPSLTKLSWSDNQREKLMEAFIHYGTELGEKDPYEDASRYTRSLSLLTPSCDLPCNTHRDWMDGLRFRLFFHILPPHWRMTKISTASLRLYKRHVSDCDCNILRPELRQYRERGNRRRHQRRLHASLNHRHVETVREQVPTPTTGEEERVEGRTGGDQAERTVRVSIYAYSRPVKARRKERIQLLDSITVARSFEGWLKFDIRSAVTTWFQNPVKNYGLQVRVEDNQRRELDPFSVVTPANCTLNNNFSLPFPLAVTDDDANDTDAAGNQTTPYLELVTLGIPQSHSLNRRDTAPAQIACGRRATSRTREHHSRAVRSPETPMKEQIIRNQNAQYNGRGK